MSLYTIKEHLINVILIPKSKVLLLKIWTLQASVAVSLTYLNLLDTYKHFTCLFNRSNATYLSS